MHVTNSTIYHESPERRKGQLKLKMFRHPAETKDLALMRSESCITAACNTYNQTLLLTIQWYKGN
jgi:hypothetical protein